MKILVLSIMDATVHLNRCQKIKMNIFETISLKYKLNLILLSQLMENTRMQKGNVLVEDLACGVPVIALSLIHI